jgi:hypothetical protein
MALDIVSVLFFLTGESLRKIEPPNKHMVHLAQTMQAQGLRAGDKVAWLGQSLEAVWLGLDRAQIAVEIPVGTRHLDDKYGRPLAYSFDNTDRFWRAFSLEKNQVFEAFRNTGAKWAFADSVPNWASLEGWIPAGPSHAWRNGDRPFVYYRKLD